MWYDISSLGAKFTVSTYLIILPFDVREIDRLKENIMNSKKIILFLSLALILMLISACSPAAETTAPTPDMSINTAIAEKAQAGVLGTLTQIALSIPSNTPTPFFTETAMQTSTMIPLPTSNKPMISVSKETNCRLGPDTVYERVGQLDPGVMAEVFGLDPTRYYYYIQNPNQPGSFCWIWGFYVTRVNDFVGVPIFTPAYTPIPVNTSTPGSSTTPTVTGTITTPKPACTFVSQLPANNTKFKPGQSYVDLNWTVKNTSLATWDKANVSFKFVSGTNLHNVSTSNLPANVDPDTNATLLLDMNVPAANGTYTETWALVQSSTTLCSITLSIIVAP